MIGDVLVTVGDPRDDLVLFNVMYNLIQSGPTLINNEVHQENLGSATINININVHYNQFYLSKHNIVFNT